MILLQAIGISVFLLSIWRIFTTLRARSSLENIPGPPSTSIWTGVIRQLSGPNAWGFHKEIVEKYGGIIKIKGLLGENQLYVFDSKALHQIFTKVIFNSDCTGTLLQVLTNVFGQDQHIFEETGGFIHLNQLVFGPGLLGTLGERHRKQRKMLNPVFSIAHLREMIPVFYSVMHRLRETLRTQAKEGPTEIDLLEWMSRAALELIGQGGLGYSFDPLTSKVVPHPYVAAIKGIGPASFKVFLPSRYLLPTIVKISTPWMRRIATNWVPWKPLHDVRDISDVLHKVSVQIFESKKKALSEGDEAVAKQVGQGKDILSILIRENMKASEADRLPEDEVLGQMSTFIFAATDTTSGALARIFHLLSLHQDVQEKLRQELRMAKEEFGRDLSYDELVALPYLDAICRETLRLHPPVNRVSRCTREDVALSLSNPIRGVDGREMTEIAIPKNTTVIVGIMACNRNPEIWGPDASEWKPERWLKPLPDTVARARLPGVYSNLMTFIGGSRACIGFKFSQLEMKIVLSLLIDSFKFSPSDKEIFWKMSGIARPTVSSPYNPDSQLPIMMELIE